MKKVFSCAAALAALACLIILFSGGSGDIPTGKELKPPAQINFFHYFSGALSGGIDEMVETVNTIQPDRTVIASGLDHEAFKTMILDSLNRGNPPELFSYWAGERVRQLVIKDQLQPIDELWNKQNLSASFPPVIIESAVSYNGKKYLLPITQHIVVFFYNKNVFDSLGLAVPQSWPEFLSLCATLQQRGVTPLALGARERWPAQFWFDYLLLRTAGPDYRRRLVQGQQSYTDPEVVNAYRIWSELLNKHYFNADANQIDWAEATGLVREGKAAMTLMGTWAIQPLEKEPYNLQPGRDYDFFPFPQIDEGLPHVSIGPIDGIILSRKAENHALVGEVLSYFAGRKAQEIMSTGSGALSPNSQVPESFYSPFKLRLKKEIDRSDQWAFAFDLATPPAIADKGMDSFSELIEFPAQYREILEDLERECKKEISNPPR